MAGAMLTPHAYPFTPLIGAIARFLDIIALAGIVSAVVAGLRFMRRRPVNPVSMSALMYSIFALAITRPRYWNDCISYSRVFTPLLVVGSLNAVKWTDGIRRWFWVLGPTLLVSLRIGFELSSQVSGVLRGVAGR
jgi:hypothetical protein